MSRGCSPLGRAPSGPSGPDMGPRSGMSALGPTGTSGTTCAGSLQGSRPVAYTWATRSSCRGQLGRAAPRLAGVRHGRGGRGHDERQVGGRGGGLVHRKAQCVAAITQPRYAEVVASVGSAVRWVAVTEPQIGRARSG